MVVVVYFLDHIVLCYNFFFFFNDTATTEIYTLSLHDALPICSSCGPRLYPPWRRRTPCRRADRKSTRLNSSHGSISYAVFCLNKQNNQKTRHSVPKILPFQTTAMPHSQNN